MDKKSIIGFVLMGLILFGYSWYQGEQDKKAREAYMAAQREQFVADSIDRAEHPEKYLHELVEQKSDEQLHSEALAAYQQQAQQRLENDLARNFGEKLVGALSGEEQFYVLENDVMTMTISSLGAKVSDVTLKEYKKYSDSEDGGEQIKMFDPKNAKFDLGFYMRRGYSESKLNTEGFYFESAGVESVVLADGVEAQRLSMRLPMDEGSYLEFLYTMRPNDYMVDFDVRFVNMGEWMRNATSFDVTWNNTSYQNERGYKNENMYTTISYLFPEERKVEKLPFAEVGKRGNGSRSETIKTEFEWFAFQQQFFSSIMIAPEGFSNGEVGFDTYKPNTGYIKDFKASVSVPYDSAKSTYNFKFYYGPNKYSLLKEYDLGLEKIVQLGGRLVSWVNRWIVIPVFDFLSRFIGNYGLIILILTLFIKLIIFPLTYKSMISSAKMRAIRPEIMAIQAKYPKAQTDQNEMMKSQQATMELYKKYGVSPMGGCLPMLIQFPVLIAMFRFFPTAIELRGESFLWMKDLSTYDSVLNLPFNIPWYGDHVSLMALIMAVTLFFYTKLTYKEQEQQTAAAPGMAGMKFMMLYFTPLMMLMWMNNYASGLCYYYFVSQMITIIINFAFRYGINDERLRAKMLAKAKANAAAPKKKSKWQQRLEEAQRQQEAMLKERERKQYRSKH
ncbi:MAG: membrane protein insertase YidC [Tidjanibacter sp.]|nr:membrane protein insertase YidC [Tidjanibacter sp.]